LKGLKKFIDNTLKPPFEEGGKLHKFWPVIDSLDTFAFVPGHVTKKGAHIRDGIDMKRTMFLVIVALIPCLLFGMYNVGFQHYMALGMQASFGEMFLFGMLKVLPLVIVSYGVGLGIEFIFCIAKSHAINEGFLVSGMLIPLCMPVDVPLWMVAVATAFAVVIGKEVFGGTGMNILNVALTARAFLFFAYPTKMSGNKVWVNTADGTPLDGFTGETLLAQATTTPVQEFTNTAGVMYTSVQSSFMDAVIGFVPGSVGETSVIACLIGAGILLWTGIASWRIMLSALAGGVVMGMIFNWMGPAYFPDNSFLALPWWYHLAIGGFMFGIVFMATDPVTASQTATGKIIYGFLIGFLAILIRTVNPAYPEGVMMAVLFMNVMAPMIDHYVIEANIKRRMKRLKVKTA
jgi:Na+-transporting NADH:ubiquinone oxidoreductase subunit B